MVEIVFERIENIAGQGENAGYQCFQNPSSSRSIKPSPVGRSVGSALDLRRERRWFHPWLCQYSFQELMTVIATVLIPL